MINGNNVRTMIHSDDITITAKFGRSNGRIIGLPKAAGYKKNLTRNRGNSCLDFNEGRNMYRGS
jgi:hypothetical protein